MCAGSRARRSALPARLPASNHAVSWLPLLSPHLHVQAQLLRAIHRGLEGEVPRLQPLHLASALWAYAVVGIPADWTDALLQQARARPGRAALLIAVPCRFLLACGGLPACRPACSQLPGRAHRCLSAAHLSCRLQVAEQELGLSRLAGYSTKELTSLMYAYGRLQRCVSSQLAGWRPAGGWGAGAPV